MQGSSPESVLHLILEGIGVLGVGALSFLGLKIQTAVDAVRLEQAQQQAELKNEFNAKHAENTRIIAVHQGEDKVMFDGISRTLTRIDNKLDHITDRR